MSKSWSVETYLFPDSSSAYVEKIVVCGNTPKFQLYVVGENRELKQIGIPIPYLSETRKLLEDFFSSRLDEDTKISTTEPGWSKEFCIKPLPKSINPTSTLY